MAKLWLIAAAWLVLALLAPELRPLLGIGSFCWVTGMMVGYQKGFAAKVELMSARAERQAERASMRTIEA